MKQSNGDFFIVFFVVWVLLAAFSAAFFYFNKDPVLKRKLHPPFVIGTGVLFAAFVLLMSPSESPFVAIPIIALIVFLNLRSTQFCLSCGATVISQNLVVRSRFCSKCGAKFDT